MSELFELKDKYSFRDPRAIRRFLQAHPDLVGVLLEAPEHIDQHFVDCELVLELSRNYCKSGRSLLFVYIRTALPVDDALDRLDALDDAWFLGLPDTIADWLCADIEFK